MAATDSKLAGKVALITGASSGIGLAIARTFLNPMASRLAPFVLVE